MAANCGAKLRSSARSAARASRPLLARISWARARPSFSHAAPALAAAHTSCAVKRVCKSAHSATVRVVLAAPKIGVTAAACSVARAADQAGLTPSRSGNVRPASIRASGKPATSAAERVSSFAAIARNSVSLRLRAASARASKAARRQRAKKSSILARTAPIAADAAEVCSPSGSTAAEAPEVAQAA